MIRTLLLHLLPVAVSAQAPRGWNSWDCAANDVNETTILAAAEYVAHNLLQYGYDTITLDGGWYNSVDSTAVLDGFGRPLPAPEKFPSASEGKGLRPLADKIHALGLKIGAWTIRGLPIEAIQANLPIANSAYHAKDAIRSDRNCTWDARLQGTNAPSAAATAWYVALANWYAEQTLDFVKIDCMWPGSPGGQPFDEDVAAFAAAFSSAAPQIAISWSPGDGMTVQNGSYIAARGGAYGVMYRVTRDFHDSEGVASLRQHLAIAAAFAPLIGVNGTYPDLDMLPFGQQAHGGANLFSRGEQRLIMTLWAVTRAPLIVGAALPLAADDDWTLPLLTNREVLAVNNASTGNTPVPVSGVANATDLAAWVAIPDASASTAIVALFNAQDADVAAMGVALPPPGVVAPPQCWRAVDLWTGQALPGTWSGTGPFLASVPAHDAAMFRLEAC